MSMSMCEGIAFYGTEEFAQRSEAYLRKTERDII